MDPYRTNQKKADSAAFDEALRAACDQPSGSIAYIQLRPEAFRRWVEAVREQAKGGKLDVTEHHAGVTSAPTDETIARVTVTDGTRSFDVGRALV